LVDFLVADDFVVLCLVVLFLDFLLTLCDVAFFGAAILVVGVVGATAGAFIAGAVVTLPEGAWA
jgi:hypothetical protein